MLKSFLGPVAKFAKESQAGRVRNSGDRSDPRTIPAGTRLRAIRTERGLTQAAFAGRLGLSASYYNQLEHDRRPVSADLAARIATAAGIDPGWLDTAVDAQLLAEIRDTVLPYLPPGRETDVELRSWVQSMPTVARAVLAAQRQLLSASGPASDTAGDYLRSPHEEVRDFFHDRRNHIAPLDEAAEKLVAQWDLTPGEMDTGLARVLHAVHGVSVVSLPADETAETADRRRLDPATRTLQIAGWLRPGQRAFQFAMQLALLQHGEMIDDIVAGASGLTPQAARLARVGLAQYFAGATVLPYEHFRQSAETSRYDIDLLSTRYGVGYETVCHRLSTLQRPGSRGVPFFLVRTDRAGNISKRQSATTFHFSRAGGSCPLWVVHEAFDAAGRIHRQVSVLPDGRTYLWIARTVAARSLRFGGPQPVFAIGLGCDIRHAHRLVYSDGLDLADRQAATPIGPGCRTCERTDCAQRAFPMLGRPLLADPSRSPALPYA